MAPHLRQKKCDESTAPSDVNHERANVMLRWATSPRILLRDGGDSYFPSLGTSALQNRVLFASWSHTPIIRYVDELQMSIASALRIGLIYPTGADRRSDHDPEVDT